MTSISMDSQPLLAGHLSLLLLTSPAKIALIESLPQPTDSGLPESALHPIAMPGTDIWRDLNELESLALVDRTEGTVRRTAAIEDLIAIRTALFEWSWDGRQTANDSAEIPAAPPLAYLVHRIWATDILVHLALHPASPKQVGQVLPGYSLSTIKRYLHGANKANLLGKGLDGNRRSQYSLTRFGLLLIRPLCCALRFEQRHLSDFTLPPSAETLRAGLAVVARLLQLESGQDRDILFEVSNDVGEPIVVLLALYRDGVLAGIEPAEHDDGPLCIRGSASAWYDLIVDGDLGGMLAINRGATTVLRQIPREFRR